MAKKKAAAPAEFGTWSVGRMTSPVPVMEGQELLEPEVVLWLDQQGKTYVELGVGPAGQREALQKSLRRMTKECPRPREVRVSEAALEAPVREVLGEGVAIHVAADPHIAAALSSLSQSLSASAPSPVFETGIPAAVFDSFHGAAARLFEAWPWRIIPSDEDILAVDLPAFGIHDAVLSVIGQMGESHGVLLFRSLDEYNQFRAAGMADQEGAPDRESLTGCEILSINFEPEDELVPPVRKQLKDKGAKDLGGGVLPAIMCLHGAGEARPAARRDLEVAAAVSDGLARFLGEHAIKLQDPPGEALVSTLTLSSLPLAPVMTLRYPHPRADEIIGKGEGADEDDTPYDDLLLPFLGDMEDAGRSEEWVQLADYLCGMLCYFHDEVQGQDMSLWSAADFEAFMLNFYPANVEDDVREELSPLVPEILTAFAQFLRTEETITGRAAAAIVKRIEEAREKFALALAPKKAPRPAKKAAKKGKPRG